MEFKAVKVAFKTLDVKVRPEPDEKDSRALSEGELTRVGTCGVLKVGGPLVRVTSDWAGNIW